MNERIKELAVQADFMLCEDGHFYSEGQSQKTTDGLQKFAELIVRECMAKVCEELDNSYSEDGKEILNERVLEHFGVEK